jgi:ribosome-associated heat shock protein Hsp15
MSEATRSRLDKWLWHARFFRTRERAAEACEAGRVRLNRQVVLKPHHVVRPGDVLTFAQGDHIRVVRVLALAQRRGDARNARGLYADLAPYDLSNLPSVSTTSEDAKP